MNIGLVLSGGMAKGAYQIGALKALETFIPMNEVKFISCASVGVLNGYAYTTGKLSQAEEMWRNVCNDDARLIVSQILRSSMLQQNINNLFSSELEFTRTFYASLLDFNHHTVVYKNLKSVKSEDVPKYLKASVAMPIYNHAVTIDGISYFDGAMADNIPVFPLLKHSLDYIICIYFDDCSYIFENTYFDNKIVKLTFPCESLLKQSLVLQSSSIAQMIEDGYNYTYYNLNAVFSQGYDNLDTVYQAIVYMNEKNRNAKLRITGDVLVTNLNRVVQRLTKRKII
ncbi:MAG: patatin-like phospholipase family protein [Lachnospiraceae bacterium]|nr:patatin-like phospholipase family protein [Lachnospiraceae bacterium]